ncbi:MAG: hypothetical protein ABIY52_13735 [Gemmatimonadaceae bacterium]
MRAYRSLLLALSLGIVAPLAGACRSSNAYDVNSTEPDRVLLTVKNDNFLEADIYALSNGLATRIGVVSGLSTKDFALNSTLYSATDFRIVAAPIGGNGRASSGPLPVHSGQSIEFTVGNRLAASHADIH